MCQLRAFLEARLAATLSCEVVALSREAMRELLDQCRCDNPVATDDRDDERHDGDDRHWTVRELAPRLGFGESTLRALLAGGLLGPPETLKLNGKTYSGPENAGPSPP